MTYFVAALYGLIQGLTEFLPISSDGHLALAAMALGDVMALPLSTVVLLHVGTLIATFAILRLEVRTAALATLGALRAPRTLSSTPEGRTVRTVALATVPTALVGLGLHDAVEPLAQSMMVVGACLIGTAALVGSTRWTGPKTTVDEPSLSVLGAIVLGVAQGLAVLPGLSRSGTTIAVAMMLGLRPRAAFQLSFLLSLPAVAGAVVLELRHAEAWSTAGVPGLLGAAVALGVGALALTWVRAWLEQGRFAWFAVYCAILGLALCVVSLS